MIGIDLEADTLGGVTTLLAGVAIVIGVLLLSGLYALLMWVGLVLLGAIIFYFGGRRLYRYFDEELLNNNDPPSREQGWE